MATFGNVSVVMMARAASSQARREKRFATSLSSTPLNFVASSGSPITPVEARKISLMGAPVALPAISAVSLVACAPALPVKALALPELTTHRPRLAALQLRAAPVHRRRRALRFREHAGDLRTLVEQREHHVGAALVPDARLGGRERHAVYVGQVGIGFRRERRDGRRREPLSEPCQSEWTCADVPGATGRRQG